MITYNISLSSLTSFQYQYGYHTPNIKTDETQGNFPFLPSGALVTEPFELNLDKYVFI